MNIDDATQSILELYTEINYFMDSIPDLTDCSKDVKHEMMSNYVADLSKDLINDRIGDVATLQSADYLIAIKLAIRVKRTNQHKSSKGYETILTDYEYKLAIELGNAKFETWCLTEDRDYYKGRVAFFDHYCERLELNEIDKQE